MKAYIVTEEHDGRGCVRFANHNIVARREGANQLDCDFESVSCRREPAFDAYADTGEVPRDVMVDHGWWFECMNCSQKICSEPENEDGEPVELAPVYEGEWCFCSQRCRHAFHAEKADQKARADAAESAALAKWPGIEICHVNGYENPARVWFKFPGGGHTQCDWTHGADTLLVPQIDLAAWRSFEDSLRVARENVQPLVAP